MDVCSGRKQLNDQQHDRLRILALPPRPQSATLARFRLLPDHRLGVLFYSHVCAARSAADYQTGGMLHRRWFLCYYYRVCYYAQQERVRICIQ